LPAKPWSQDTLAGRQRGAENLTWNAVAEGRLDLVMLGESP
jgi:hypothetical protein